MFRVLVAGTAALISASGLHAQITTYVPPPRPAARNAQAAAAADSARRDSVRQVVMSKNMRAWVDSAAGVSIPSDAATDGAVADHEPDAEPPREVAPEVSRRPRPTIETFSNGSVRPATGSDLPVLTVLGVAILAVGAGLLSNRPRS